jgi:hypothetical protein
MNETILKRFIDNDGLVVLNQWVQEALEHFDKLMVENNSEVSPKLDPYYKEYLNKLLSSLNKLPITVDLLVSVKIGKGV